MESSSGLSHQKTAVVDTKEGSAIQERGRTLSRELEGFRKKKSQSVQDGRREGNLSIGTQPGGRIHPAAGGGSYWLSRNEKWISIHKGVEYGPNAGTKCG